ncbi:MAG: hypothetical protein QOH10_343 [Actinomycetota bacterium]|jgi:hypothetical protein|nr:hypothetical protein [Actinomycetota bacterium]
MTSPRASNDRLLGAACLVACPAVSGVFLALIAAVCVYPTEGGHTFAVSALVGVSGFAVNALAICVTAVAHAHTRVRSRHTSRTLDVPLATPARAQVALAIGRRFVPTATVAEIGRRSS